MRFIKPPWLTHGGEKKDFEVYSCHVSPDGRRLCTAAADGHLRVWSTEAIYNASDPGYAGPKQLAAMSHHSGVIHTVRFSPNNRLLASGADDRIVCVYVLDPNPPTHQAGFGSNEPPPVENWRIYRRIIGHESDVTDLAWAADSSLLVSVGTDSKVLVWSGTTFDKIKTINQHQSYVKGVTFDPANKYFATASDDRTVKIWSFQSPSPGEKGSETSANINLVTTVSDPFTASPLSAYFRRCSWSPDGMHIAAANAVNGPVSTVAIINRGAWDSEINLIGHEGPVEVCAFSPRLFCQIPYEKAMRTTNGNPTTVTVIACAGQDRSLSVWNTSYPRPLVIVQDLASKSISDLGWAPEGDRLFMTSLDGSIMVACFEAGELGYVAPMQENEKSLTKFGASRRPGIVEGTEAFILEELSKAKEMAGVQDRMGELMGDSQLNGRLDGLANGSTEKQTNGITTTAVNPETASAPGTSSVTVNGHTLMSSDAPQPAQRGPPPSEKDGRVERLKQRVTITKDGKKRIAPLLISSSGLGKGTANLPQTQLVAKAGGGNTTLDGAPASTLDLSRPYEGLPEGGLLGLLIGNRRKIAPTVDGNEEHGAARLLENARRAGVTPVVVNGETGLEPPYASTASANPPVPEVLHPAITSPALTVSQMRLAVPLVRSVIYRPLSASFASDGAPADESNTTLLEARNAAGPTKTSKDPTRITCSRRGNILWTDYLPRAVLLLTGNPRFWAAACEDGSVYVWTPAGRRLINATVLEAQPVIMDCKGWYLLVISAVGMVHVWNLKTQSAPHPPVSLGPALDVAFAQPQEHLTKTPGVVFARLNSVGRVVVALTNGDGYTYNPNMFAWQRLSEPWWAVGSQYWNTLDSSSSVGNLQGGQDKGQLHGFEKDDPVAPENLSAGIIPLLERNTTGQFLLKGRAYALSKLVKTLLGAEGFENFEANVSLAHLENRVAAALTLGAREEFRVYLGMYAKRLGAEGMRGKIEELLGNLLGSIYEQDGTAGGNAQANGAREGGWYGEADRICGWNKKDLLKEIVLILGKHRDLQRITVPYATLLGITGQGSCNDGAMATDV